MKKLIKRCQEGNSISWADVGDAASYMIPVYGTYRSFKDAVEDPSLANWGLAGLSLVGDIATIAGGAGLALKGIKSGSKAAKAYLEVAGNYERLASEIAKEASKINPKSSAKALKKADNLANDAIGTWETALDYRAIAAKEKQGVIRSVGDAGKIAAGSTAAFKGPKAVSKASELDRNKRRSSTLKKTLKKVTPSNGDLVRKRTEPFLYNNFLKKDGGTMNLILKYQDGGKNPLIETAKYVTPVVGSYYSIVDAIDDPSWQNILSAGGSVAGDLLLLTGVGAAAKIPGALKALNNARKAQKAIELTAANAGKLAKSYAAAGDMKKVNLILDGVKAYYNCASDIGLKLDNLRNAYETVLSIALTGIKAGVVAKGLNSGTKIAALELTKKQNLVEKRQDSSWLYNDFSNTEQHKNGGIMKNLIPKHQTGKKIKSPTLTNTDGRPLGLEGAGNAYAYSDKEGYTGEQYDYDSGMQIVRKYKLVVDRNGNPYNREVRQLFWPRGHLESDTVYIYRLPNGRNIRVQKGSKQYEWLQQHTHDSKGLGYWWDKFTSLFGYKYGGKLIPKHQDGRRILYGSSTNLPQVNLPEMTVRGTKLPLLPAMIVDRYYEGNLPSGLYASTKNNPDRSLLYVNPSITAKNRAAQTILKTQIDNIEKQKKFADAAASKIREVLGFTKKDGGLIERYGNGGDIDQQAAEIGQEAVNVGKYFIPGVGTYYSWKDVIDDPSLLNISLAGLSTIGDATLIFGGSGEALNAIAAGGKASKYAAEAAKWAQATEKLKKSAWGFGKMKDKVISVPKDAPSLFQFLNTARRNALEQKIIQRVEAALKAEGKGFKAESAAKAAKAEAVSHAAKAGAHVGAGVAAKVPYGLYRAEKNNNNKSKRKDNYVEKKSQNNYVEKQTNPWWNPFN